jgi:hypothetical protein
MLSVQELSEVVDRLSSAISRQPGHGVQIVQLVTAADPIGLANPSDNARQAAQRVAGLMIATALLMQHSLADFDSHVPKAPSGSDLRNRLVESWRVVVAHDYRSIFLTALQILETLGDSEASLDIELQHAVEVTRKIVKRQILGRQDLVGRIYHSLLSSQKYLATYYTRVSAAILLAGLATNPRLWEPSKFVLRDNEFDFRICDPAQGTGTLLSATLTEIRKYLLRKNDSKIDLNKISKDLIESQIWGFDILAYAVQVAATTLLLSAPGTVIEKSQLFQLGFGGEEGTTATKLRGSCSERLGSAWVWIRCRR